MPSGMPQNIAVHAPSGAAYFFRAGIPSAMNLHINGEERAFPAPTGLTLAALIESLSMKSDRVAVELNRDIVPRDRWPETHLKDGDRLEIVHFVGGGRC
jgi:thiamine biosynthesis protein ThiS